MDSSFGLILYYNICHKPVVKVYRLRYLHVDRVDWEVVDGVRGGCLFLLLVPSPFVPGSPSLAVKPIANR